MIPQLIAASLGSGGRRVAPQSAALTGLDFPSNTGNGQNSGSVRFKFTGAALPPIYGTSGAGLTYLWKYRPRQQTGYYTTFFWANDGGVGTVNSDFLWDGGAANSYYGAHPYPPGSSAGTTHKWEISIEQQDFQNGDVVKDVWYMQGFRCRGAVGAQKEHEFYWNMPALDSANRVFRTTAGAWGDTAPPSPALTFGDAPWEPTKERLSGVLRGVQIYQGYLSTAHMVALCALEYDAEVLAYLSANSITGLWYLNMNPASVDDISDKSGAGHDPAWLNANRPTLYTA